MKNVNYYRCATKHLCRIAKDYRGVNNCERMPCEDCLIRTAEWLLEEHVTDWSRVTPFVPVRVKDKGEDQWYSGFFFIGYHRVNDVEYYVVSNTPDVESAGKSFSVYDCCRINSEFND